MMRASEASRSAFGWTREPPSGWHGDARGLAEALTRELGPDGVRFGDGERALYATDASNYRQVPIGVVRPRNAGEVEAAVALCRRFGAPVLGRGGGTSLAGQCCNVAVVLDFSRHMNRVLEIDPERRLARVEPGTVLDDLRRETWKIGLTFGPDPATHAQCTLGGMIGNNSCGVHSVMAGRTADNVRALDVLTYDGARFAAGALSGGELARALSGTTGNDRRAEIVRRLVAIRDRYGDLVRERFPRIPRRVSGYNLDELLPENGFHLGRFLVGSEGTLALTLESTLELVPWPAERVVLAAGFSDIYAAADAVPTVLETGPIGLEGMDDRLVREQRVKRMNPAGLELLPPGGAADGGWLLIELGAETRAEAVARAERTRRALAGVPGFTGARLLVEPAEQAAIWVVRESGLGATAKVPGRPDMWEGWEDSAVPPERMGDYLRDLRKLYERYGYEGSFYGHFGEGCLHTRTSFDLESEPGIAAFRDFVGEAAELVVGYGGSISGEHGDGQARGELLPLQFGDELCRAFSEVKHAWDPGNRMNPGKLAEPYPLVSNLRLGADHDPWEPETVFGFPRDDGRFSRAAGRCVGVGKCRRDEGGVMCPSYRATREERHSTRGRARLLFELLEGEAIAPSWRSEEVEDALRLCLSCKGCKTECPVNVDMATYKAEFLHHRYRRRLRPRAAYAMGLVHWWARIAAKAPRLANALARGRWTGRLAKKLAGVAPERTLPAFATETFRAGFRKRRSAEATGRRVILWTDTFDDHFQPDVAWAAVEVLEAAGFEVEIPEKVLCCGRPLYDHGMLDLARRQLRRILDALGPDLREGAPIVVLEPSCLAVFRDELPNLMPDGSVEGGDARKLTEQSVTLAELLERHAPDWSPPPLAAEALVHAHCHHRAVLGLDADLRLLDRLGLDYRLLDSGCCGMAGAFGYEAGEKSRVAAAVGEHVLLPAVRAAGPETLIVTDGFSCRSQIAQGTGREPLHLAQVLRLALRAGQRRSTGLQGLFDPLHEE